MKDGNGILCSLSKDILRAGSHPAKMSRKASNKTVNHLRAWREFRRLTQDELGEAVGTTGGVISLLESGGRRLSDKWLYKLAPALRTRAGFLLEFDPHDADLEILEAAIDIGKERKGEALRLLKVFKTGTGD